MPKIDIRYIAMGISLAVAMLMLAGKLTAYYLTGSSAIMSDAVESVVHIIATGIAAFSLWFSHQSACERHPYGHGKIAYFSAGFEGALILTAAVFIMYTAIRALILGAELHDLHIGIALTGLLAATNLALGIFLITVGKRKNALILVSNGKHVLTDVWTSAGVVIGVTIVWLTGIPWLDPLVAFFVGANILYGAWSLMNRSFRGLLDEADPNLTNRLLACLQDNVTNGHLLGFHQLRHRQSNDVMWVEVHMLLSDDLATGEAHVKVTETEESVRSKFPEYNVYITSHVEPVHHEDAHPGGHTGIGDPYADSTFAHPAELPPHGP